MHDHSHYVLRNYRNKFTGTIINEVAFHISPRLLYIEVMHVMQLSSLIVPVKVLFLYIFQCIVTVMMYVVQLPFKKVPVKVLYL